MTTIIPVKKSGDLKRFINLPHSLYKGDEIYTPELNIVQKELFDQNKNPFFKHSEVKLLLAERYGNAVGRIAVFSNDNHNKYSGKKDCFFGFFECVNDYQVAEMLLKEAVWFARTNDLTSISGPFNFSVHDSCGILINGFDRPAVIAMPYNKPYYQDFLNRFGFSKKIDMFAYEILTDHTPERLLRMRDVLERRLYDRGVVVRSMSTKNFDSEIEKLHKAYNEAFKNNWGFFPLTLDELKFKAKGIKAVGDPEMLLIAEQNGEAVGFLITLPDINQVLRRIPNGKLFPLGLFKLLYYKKKVDNCRLSVLGVVDKFRNSGLEIVFCVKEYEIARKRGIKTSEASYVMEDNAVMINLIKSIGAKKTKDFRIFEICLNDA